MELILNAAWLIIAVASYILYFRRLARRGPERDRGPSQFPSLVALSCALAILFPVISLSDDLQEMQAAVLEVSPSRLVIKKSGMNDTSHLGKKLNQAFLIVSPLVMDASWINLGFAPTRQPFEAILRPHLTALCRAPPAFVIPQTS